VYDRSRSPLLSALVFVCLFLPYLFAAPLAAFGDRFPRRTLMVSADIARAGLVALMALPHVPLPILYALLLAVTAAEPIFEGSRSAITAEVFELGPTFIAASSLNALSFQALQIGGSLLGGALVALVTVHGVLLFDAVTFLASAALIRRYVTARPPAHATASGDEDDDERATPRLRDSVRDGGRVILGDRMLRSCLLYIVLIASVLMAAESLCVAQARALGHGDVAAGWLAAAMPIGGCLGTVLFGRFLTGARARRALLPGAALTMLPLILTGYHPTLPTVFALWTVAGLGAGAINLVMPIYTAKIPNEYRSLGYGIGSTGLMVGQGVASLTGGLIATAVGATLTVTLLGELGLLAVAALAARWPALPAFPGEAPTSDPAEGQGAAAPTAPQATAMPAEA
jgi:MFS family permease